MARGCAQPRSRDTVLSGPGAQHGGGMWAGPAGKRAAQTTRGTLPGATVTFHLSLHLLPPVLCCGSPSQEADQWAGMHMCLTAATGHSKHTALRPRPLLRGWPGSHASPCAHEAQSVVKQEGTACKANLTFMWGL